MDTETILFLDSSQVNCSDYTKLSEEHFQAIDVYVKTVYCLQEIHQLFQIFRYNFNLLHSLYTLWGNGRITPLNPNETIESQYISINAHIINIISSGHAIDEAMQRYLRPEVDLLNDSSVQSDFSDYRSAVFESSFSYRLLDGLRNYAQHGHLLISSKNGLFGFNLIRILNTLHFSHKKPYETELRTVIEETFQTLHNVPMQSLTTGLAEYVVHLLSLYVHFWKCIKTDLFEKVENVKHVIAQCKKNLLNIPNPDLFLYNCIDSRKDIISVKDVERTEEVFYDIYYEAITTCEECTHSYKELFSH